MKKVSFLVLFLLMLLVTSMPAFASASQSDLKDVLAPYQEIIDGMNAEYGTAIAFTDDLEKIYASIENKSLAEYEGYIRSLCIEASQMPAEVILSAPAAEVTASISPRGPVYEIDVEQRFYLSESPVNYLYFQSRILDNSGDKTYMFNISAGSAWTRNTKHLEMIGYGFMQQSPYTYQIHYSCNMIAADGSLLLGMQTYTITYVPNMPWYSFTM